MKKKSIQKMVLNAKTISNLQHNIAGGASSVLSKNSYENSCMAGICRSINEITECYCEEF